MAASCLAVGKLRAVSSLRLAAGASSRSSMDTSLTPRSAHSEKIVEGLAQPGRAGDQRTAVQHRLAVARLEQRAALAQQQRRGSDAPGAQIVDPERVDASG